MPRLASALVSAGLLAGLGLGSAVAADGAVTFTPGGTYRWFDSDAGLEDQAGLRLGLGYEWDEQWSLEAVIGSTDTELEDGGPDTQLRYAELDWLYHFRAGEATRPYIVAGVGHEQIDVDGAEEDETTRLALGAGLKYDFNESVFLRGDVRRVHLTDSDINDTQLMLGVGFRFGGGEEPYEPVVEPVAATEPEPADTDSDGVIDERDRCPGTAAGVEVDASGCPLDQDEDGVADARDRCPDTPAGARVDEAGCQIILEEEVSISLDVEFPFDSAQIQPRYYEEIREVARFMREYPSTEAIIEGHTDSVGPAEYNQRLSQQRAEAVREVLVQQFGVEPDRLSARGYGETRPIESNATEAGRQENRRVVAVLKATKATALRREDAAG